MKSSKNLIQTLIAECGKITGVPVGRDIIEVSHRVAHEGQSFLTITLPEIAEGLERGLDRGFADRIDFPHFKCVKSGGYPEFLQGFFRLVFDGTTVRTDASTDAIFCIRQISLFYKKIFEVCDDDRVNAQLRKFVETDSELEDVEATRSLIRSFSFLFSRPLEQLTRSINSFSLPVKHGPGATADRKLGNEKFVADVWHDRLEQVFPFGEYCLPNWRYFKEYQPRYLDESEEPPVKVTPVPKTKRKPRLIAIEPTAMQYAQQGIMNELVPLLERDPRCGSLIGFTDQTPNQALAQIGSVSRDITTIDLSDASDRVAYSLVKSLFAWWPDVWDALDASRSRNAKLPNGDVIPLKKFASMGSATCFPVEAMVFTAIAFNAIAGETGSRDSAYAQCVGKFHVYGDDIIVPTDYAEVVVKALEDFGLKVNQSKTFSQGLFRESCGRDFYAGMPVNPTYMRVDPDATTHSAEWFTSIVETANLLSENGLTITAEALRAEVERDLGPLPYVGETSQGLGWRFIEPLLKKEDKVRWNSLLHRYEVKTYVVHAPAHRYEIDGPFALLKSFKGDWTDPMYREHLQASGRPSCVKLHKRWIDTGVEPVQDCSG